MYKREDVQDLIDACSNFEQEYNGEISPFSQDAMIWALKDLFSALDKIKE